MLDSGRRALAVSGLSLLVVFLLVFQLLDGVRSSRLMVGVEMEESPAGLEIILLSEEGPAEAAGIRLGDRILEVNGRAVTSYLDYDEAAGLFVPERPIFLRVERGRDVLGFEVVPGMPFPRLAFAVTVLAALLHLGLGLLALSQRPGDPRARLLTLLAFAVAIELSLPAQVLGSGFLTALLGATLALLTGLQFGLELHLASVIPEPSRWLRRHRWVVPGYYVLGTVPAVVLALALLAEWGRWTLPWNRAQAEFAVYDLGLPVWALCVVALLAGAALRWPYPVGRAQAGLVMIGVLPWSIYVLATGVLDLLGKPVPEAFAVLEPLVLLIYPIAVFVAVFRYHLFDIELVVRRGLLYTALSSSLLLVFYAVLGAAGALMSRVVEGPVQAMWAIGGATLVLGLAFSPLRRWLDQEIENRFFPERIAMRKRLVNLAGQLPAHGNLLSMGQALVDKLREIFAIQSATLLLADRGSGLLVTLAASTGEFESSTRSFLLSPRDAGVAEIRRARRPVPARQLLAAGSPLSERLAGTHAVLVVPILHQEQLVGLLLLGDKASGEPYPGEEVELLDLFSRHLATVFENARLFESATQDSLTGLLRREATLEMLQREVERALRYRRPLTVGMVDLDHFKQINDGHGHLTGDLILKEVADALGRELRTTDALGRYGGEEFLVLMPETDLRGALLVGEKLRTRVEGLRLKNQDGQPVQVTVSIGLASLDHSTMETPQDLIAAADRWLYRAKELGRNRLEPMSAGPVRLSRA